MAPIGLKTPKQNFIPKRSFRYTVRFNVTATSCKKISKNLLVAFSYNLKKLVLGLFGLNTQELDFFQKIGLRQKFDDILTFCKKKTPKSSSEEKLRQTAKQANRQMDERMKGTSKDIHSLGPKMSSVNSKKIRTMLHSD